MGHDGVVSSLRLGHKVVVGYLEERAYRRGCVTLAVCPNTHVGEGRKSRGVWAKEETAATLGRPIGQLVGDGEHLVANFLNAEEGRGLVGSDQPVPECRTEIETVVKVFGRNEDVGIEEIGHQPSTPRVCPSF